MNRSKPSIFTNRTIVLVLCIAIISAAAVLASCAGKSASQQQGAAENDSGAPPASLYLQLIDGLHVTGTPIPVDIAVYRLKVTGAVEKPLDLSFEAVKGMAAVTENMALNCPGFFTDTGDWTGVPVAAILKEAGVAATAANVTFIAIDESYKQTLPLEAALRDGMIIAYQFNGKEFSDIHGFPLRLAAKDMEGWNWVKWLGEIRVE